MDNLLALVAATLVLILVPGPNVALIVASSLEDGLKAGVVTSLGTTAGIGVQLLLVTTGLAVIVEIAANALTWIKWLGVAYLFYLGIRTWRQPAESIDLAAVRSKRRAFWRGVGLAIVNPKTLLFSAAFLPQFVGPAPGAAGDLYVVASVYLGVLLVGDPLWAVFAAAARPWLQRAARVRNRVIGGFLVGAGAGLAASRSSV